MRIIVIAILSVVLFFPTYWLFHSVVGPDWGAGIAAFGMYIAFPILALRVWKSREPVPLTSMEAALESGELLSADYSVSEAVEFAEFEDEGRSFYLAVGPTETLFLSGQYLYSPTDRGVFPSTKIRIFWHKTIGLTYGVECLGQPLSATSYPPFTEEQFENEKVPEDRQLITQDLHSVLKDVA